MPRSPAFLGNLIQAGLGRRADVLATTVLANGFLEMILRATAPAGGWHPGHEIQFRVTPTEGRRYTVHTVSGVNHDHISIIAATHAAGPGTTWLRALKPDAEITLLAGRYAPLRAGKNNRLYLGDGSTLATIDAYTRAAHNTLAVIEVPQDALTSLRGHFPHICLIAATANPGDALQFWLQDALNKQAPAHIAGAHLLGHAQSIQRQRRALLDAQALNRHAITSRPYWATGRQSL